MGVRCGRAFLRDQARIYTEVAGRKRTSISLLRRDRQDGVAPCRDRGRTGRGIRIHDSKDLSATGAKPTQLSLRDVFSELRRRGDAAALEHISTPGTRGVEGMLPGAAG